MSVGLASWRFPRLCNSNAQVNILLICGSLEPGADGVGDYSRRLSEYLTGQGHRVWLVAFNDRHINELSSESQKDETIIRLPECMPWEARVARLWSLANEFTPVISVQFVLFSFEKRGFCQKWLRVQHALAERFRLHLMMHELWVGLRRVDPLRVRLWGRIQRAIILYFLRRMPASVYTTNHFYRELLGEAGVDAKVLPLFSNIPVCDRDDSLLDEALSRAGLVRAGCLVLGYFGSIHEPETLRRAVLKLSLRARELKKAPVLAGIGRAGPHLPAIREFVGQRCPEVVHVHLGERSPRHISGFLQALNLGIVTTPRELLGKSGTFMAMREHRVSLWILSDGDIIDLGQDLEVANLPVGSPAGVAASLIKADMPG